MKRLLLVGTLAVAPVLALANTSSADIKGAELKDGKIYLPKHAMLPLQLEGAKIYLKGQNKAPWGFIFESGTCSATALKNKGNYPVFAHDKLVGCAHDDKVPTA